MMTTTSKFVRRAAVAALVLGIGATTAVAGGFERYERDGSIKDAPVASEGRKFEWSVNGGLMSDYVFRGVSQSGEDPSWFAGADASYGIFYAGVWAAKVDQAFTSSDAEVDLYFGIKPVLGPATFDFGVIYYGYAGQTANVDVDYWEFKAGVSGEILPKLSAGVTYYYTPDDTFEIGPGHAVEGTLGYALPKVWIFDPSISGTLGYKENEDVANSDYTYWNAGLSLAVEQLTLDFRYWGTDTDQFGDLGDDRFVFKATVALP
ncbi:MAG: TorF family putative porin [Filomicrobium sp.]|nr:TorF family putative porin [Filomicrobium sp.]